MPRAARHERGGAAARPSTPCLRQLSLSASPGRSGQLHSRRPEVLRPAAGRKQQACARQEEHCARHARHGAESDAVVAQRQGEVGAWGLGF